MFFCWYFWRSFVLAQERKKKRHLRGEKGPQSAGKKERNHEYVEREQEVQGSVEKRELRQGGKGDGHGAQSAGKKDLNPKARVKPMWLIGMPVFLEPLFFVDTREVVMAVVFFLRSPVVVTLLLVELVFIVRLRGVVTAMVFLLKADGEGVSPRGSARPLGTGLLRAAAGGWDGHGLHVEVDGAGRGSSP